MNMITNRSLILSIMFILSKNYPQDRNSGEGPQIKSASDFTTLV